MREDGWSLYYDHWCANRLDVELFWGPQLATSFVEQRDELSDRDAWLDEVWCEGGAVIDHVHRTLLWFGGEDLQHDVPWRRAHLGLMRHVWKGWDVQWAAGGIVEIGAYLGVPAERFLADGTPDEALTFGFNAEYPQDNGLLLTLRENERTVACRISGDEESLENGVKNLPKLRAFSGEESLVWHGEMPTGGIHVDIDRRFLGHWWARATSWVEQRVDRAWPGWRCHWWRDCFEEHIQAAAVEIELPHQPESVLQRRILDDLPATIHHEARNPARELGPRVGATELNPWTDETRSSVGEVAEKRRVLERLLALIDAAGA